MRRARQAPRLLAAGRALRRGGLRVRDAPRPHRADPGRPVRAAGGALEGARAMGRPARVPDGAFDRRALSRLRGGRLLARGRMPARRGERQADGSAAAGRGDGRDRSGRAGDARAARHARSIQWRGGRRRRRRAGRSQRSRVRRHLRRAARCRRARAGVAGRRSQDQGSACQPRLPLGIDGADARGLRDGREQHLLRRAADPRDLESHR